MKYKTHIKIKDSCSLISLLSNGSIENLNRLFNTYYNWNQVKKRIKILRKQKKFRFWDKLVKEKSGFDKRGKE